MKKERVPNKTERLFILQKDNKNEYEGVVMPIKL